MTTATDVVTKIDEHGFCKVPNLVSTAKAKEVRNILHKLLRDEFTDVERETCKQRVGSIVVKDQAFLELMCHPFVIEVWKTFLGEDLMCATFSANTIYPGSDKIGWHVDYPFWSVKPPWPPGRFAGQTLWMLDDFTEENGATGVVPGSHKKGHPPDGDTSQWRNDAETLTGEMGSVVFAHGAWWHTAGPNSSEHSRSCLLGMYLQPWFIPQEDMRGQLEKLENPSDLVQQLLCGKQHIPHNV